MAFSLRLRVSQCRVKRKALDELGAKMSDVENQLKENKNSEELLSELQEQLNSLKAQRDQLEKQIPKAMVMKERPEIRETRIMNRGQYDDPGEIVQRNTPEFLHPLKRSGDVASRMDLANWFIDKENPLTARVAVNRIWQQFFGVGLVKTSEDLGAQGEVPSHPMLLDYLAESL